MVPAARPACRFGLLGPAPAILGSVKITFLGQAGLFVETRGVTVLCDPWFNPAFFGSWFPFPANDGIDPAAIGSPTYLYVSHLHHDHFDARFLRDHVSKEATVLLPDYPLDHLEMQLRGLGFERFVKTANLEPFEAGPLRLMIHALVAPTDGPIGDSALLIDDGEVRVLNMNDSRPIDPEGLVVDGPLDALFLQFSGAIWYPMVYEFPEKAKRVLAHKKRVAQLARAYRYIELLDPRFVVPSAGPPCFLDDDLFGFNDLHGDDTNIFPDQTVFLDHIAWHGRKGGRLMLPGSIADVASGRFDVRHPVEPDTIFRSKRAYLEGYRARKQDVLAAERAAWQGERVALLPELKAWFDPLLAQADLIAAGINEQVLIDVGDERIVLDFVTRETRPPADDEEPRYQFFIDRPLVEHLVRNHVDDWVNELFLSMRFSARRRGAYNDYVYTWFKCLSVERLQYAEGFYAEQGPTQGTFEMAGYRLQKRCPHMKADLTRFGGIEDGVLTCQLHGWQWDVSTGRCLTSDGHQLYVKPAGEADDEDEAAGSGRSGDAEPAAAVPKSA
jgi:UDP-MurNAc hydroxylase